MDVGGMFTHSNYPAGVETILIQRCFCVCARLCACVCLCVRMQACMCVCLCALLMLCAIQDYQLLLLEKSDV